MQTELTAFYTQDSNFAFLCSETASDGRYREGPRCGGYISVLAVRLRTFWRTSCQRPQEREASSVLQCHCAK
ncbi:hypothetical protein AGIG_G22621 [Arapaima gigas]